MSFFGGDELRAVYYYFRSLSVAVPFLTAKENLLLLFEQNRARWVWRGQQGLMLAAVL
jgi:protein SMG7